MRVQAGVVQNLDSTRTQIDALVSSSQSATGALQAAQAGNQLIALQTKQLADLTAVMAAIAPRPEPRRRAQRREPGAGAAAAHATSSTTARATSPAPRRCSTDARPRSLNIRAIAPRRRLRRWSRRRSSRPRSLRAHDDAARRARHARRRPPSRSARARTGALPGDRHGGAGRRRLRSRLGREPPPLLHLSPGR